VADLDGFKADDVGVAALDGGEEVGAGFGVELEAATGGGGTFEDDVLDFLDVDIGTPDLVEDEGEDADAVVVADDELPLRGGAAGEVHAVQRGAGLHEGFDHTVGFLGDGVLGLFGGGADVVGAAEVREVEDGVVEFAGGPGGFGVEDVEAGADFPGGEGGLEGGLVHDFAAGGVDEDGVRRQEGQARGGDEPAGLGLERGVEGDDIGAAEEVIEIGAVADAEFRSGGGGEGAGPGDDFQAEGMGAGDDLAADGADADDAEGFAENAVGLGEFLLVPLVRAEGGGAIGDAAVDAEEEGEDEFGDGDGVFAGAIGDEDAEGAGGLDVDGVDAGTGAEDEGELVAGAQGFGGDLFAADDEDAMAGNQLGQFFGLGVRLVSDGATELLETFQVGFGIFIGDEYFHDQFGQSKRSAPSGCRWELFHGQGESNGMGGRGQSHIWGRRGARGNRVWGLGGRILKGREHGAARRSAAFTPLQCGQTKAGDHFHHPVVVHVVAT